MMTLKVKLISAFFVVTIFVIVVGVIGIYTTNTINKNFDNVQQETVPSMIALGQLKAAFYRMFLEAVNIAFINAEVQALYDEVDESATPKQEHEDAQEEAEEFDDMEFDEAVVDMEIWFAEYEAVVWTEEEQGMVPKLRTLIETNQNIAQELINLRLQNANRGEILEKKEELEYAKYLFSAAIERAIGVASAELEEDIQRSHQSATQAFVVNLVAIIISVLLAGFFGFFTTNAIATPITQFKEAAVKIGQGQLDTQVAIQSQDEVGVLANTFNKMAKDLKASYEQLAEYNRTLEDKVETRTHALSQANEELQTTVEQLQTTQQELIQSEKMAALGQLVAGVAHEINTPLGAINSAVGNINKFLSQTLVELPDFFRLLSKEQLSAFLDLLQRSLAKETMLSSKEERKLKRQLKRQLEEEEIEDADIKADTFVEMGIYDEVSPFLPLLQSSDRETLLDTAYRLSSLQRSSQTIDMAVQRASKVVFALKSFARYEHSGEKIEANITEGIETVLTLYQNQLKHNIKVVKHYAQLPPILCHADELNQVWTNLIHNALQAMDHTGTLTIDVSQQYNQVVISITDSGEGIASDIKDKIFEPFFTTKRAGEGSGLGLDIVKKIVEKHEGHITVESQPGKTTFTVSIPV
ncbi:MAG: hypothetical protein DRR19_21295 [Candidatus Parabeggiatoa sp. nov. 1]|nr:MAG: hypothetical protein DRR19_21295 [Gammaproteobacteria bacterium]